jgi:hypothetical protein
MPMELVLRDTAIAHRMGYMDRHSKYESKVCLVLASKGLWPDQFAQS